MTDPVVKRSIVSTSEDLVREQFEPLRAAYVRSPYMSYAERRAHLDMLCDLVRSNHQTIAEAISSDFGGRSTHETQIAEIFSPVATIKHIRSHLGGWMRSQPRRVPLTFRLAVPTLCTNPSEWLESSRHGTTRFCSPSSQLPTHSQQVTAFCSSHRNSLRAPPNC